MDEVLKAVGHKTTNPFKTYEGLLIENIEGYVTEWLVKNRDYKISIHIGCDSHVGVETKYVTTVAFLREGRGGHMVTKEDFCVGTLTMYDKLMNEVKFSLQVAESLKHLGLEITIHVDYNVDPKFKSNELYSTGLGFGSWYGYKTLGKPLAWCASYCSDRTTRIKKSRVYRKQKRKNKKKAI